ncbi:SMP-30/gluconolactonase/LRE family protein [Actinoplanes sp. NPDC051861]|uniref:SMP-30/gluconolactonase/LRE family protein n=1 Tax=Actinoplanes sp. NPDC051861 TaxID=3155170 RepID=UPI00343B2360
MTATETLMTGIALGESPRWHDGRLWFSDWGANEVLAVGTDGTSEVVAQVKSFPLCIDRLPDGRLLIVDSEHGELLRREPGGELVRHADLRSVSDHPWNDIVVDGRGNAYVGAIGSIQGPQPDGDILAVFTPDGRGRKVADNLAFPNGMTITPDGSTLIVAESNAARLTAFDIDEDGGLSNRRVWADLGENAAPDGICLDAENAVWYADVPNQRCVRVREGGEVLATVDADRGCFACELGGEDGRTLFVLAAEWPAAMEGERRTGVLLTAGAPAPRADRP